LAKNGPASNSIQVESGSQPSRITKWPMPRKSFARGSSVSVVRAGSRGVTEGSLHRNRRIGAVHSFGTQPLSRWIQAAKGSLKRWIA
jgi:hypothetical protein